MSRISVRNVNTTGTGEKYDRGRYNKNRLSDINRVRGVRHTV